MIAELTTLDGISVAEFIDALRQELTYAVASDKDQALQFGLGTVAVELSVTTARDAPGRVRLWVIPAGSDYRGSPPHKIMLNLAPVRAELGSGEVIDYDEDEPPARQTAGPVMIKRADLPQKLIDRFEESPKDYR